MQLKRHVVQNNDKVTTNATATNDQLNVVASLTGFAVVSTTVGEGVTVVVAVFGPNVIGSFGGVGGDGTSAGFVQNPSGSPSHTQLQHASE